MADPLLLAFLPPLPTPSTTTRPTLALVPPGGGDDGEDWRDQWLRALAANLDDDVLRQLAVVDNVGVTPADRTLIRAEAAALLVRDIPYRFTGREEIVSFERARRRRHAACGDGSAVVAAVAFLSSEHERDGLTISRCYETAAQRRSYAHVAIDVGGFRADPYADASLSVPRCAVVDDVRELVARCRADAKAVR